MRKSGAKSQAPSLSFKKMRPSDRLERLGAVERSFSLLECVARAGAPIAVANLIEILNLPKPTMYRMIEAFESQGLLGREIGQRKLTVGPRLVDFAFNILRSTIQQAPRRAILERLSRQIGETCNIGTLDHTEIVYLDRVEAEHWPLRLHFSIGSRVPLHCTAIGKIFLAYMPARQRRDLLQNIEMRNFTPNTIVDRDHLEDELDKVRSEGAALDNEESLLGVICVAAPILDSRGRIRAAVAMQAPTARINTKTARQYLPALKEAAALLRSSLEFATVSRPRAAR